MKQFTFCETALGILTEVSVTFMTIVFFQFFLCPHRVVISIRMQRILFFKKSYSIPNFIFDLKRLLEPFYYF